MSLDKLKKQMKEKVFSHFYLFYGEESYLIRYYKKELIKSILGEVGGMNFSSFEGKNINLKEIIGLSATLPFFSDYRVILIEHSDLFSSQNELTEFLSTFPESTILIFTEETVDKRTKLFKELSKQGLVLSFPREKAETLIHWVISYLKKNHTLISKVDASYLIFRVGESMELLSQEMEKLISFAFEKKDISKEDIDLICPETLQDKIFKLMDSIGRKDRKEALNYYYDLLDLKEPMLRILSLIERHFHILLIAKKLKEEGSPRELTDLLKLHPFVAKNYLSMSDNFSLSTLETALDYSISLDRDIKTGAINDKVAVEHLILKYTSK